MKYKCMKCGIIYEDKISSLPTIGKGDGCCSIGSLVEYDPYNSLLEDFRNWMTEWDKFDEHNFIKYPKTNLHKPMSADEFLIKLREMYIIIYNK